MVFIETCNKFEFSHFVLVFRVSVTELLRQHVLMFSGADLGFFEGGVNHGSGSLKQVVWGAQPFRSYRVFCFVKCKNATYVMQDLEYLNIEVLWERATQVVPGGVVGATHGKVYIVMH